ncbi:MAG: hypothetical protein SWH61_16600 [Thermodesulfobacteriota bacterium]|nr:hypothetical protein [Thermodesulfobacteriota bacterium]
MDDQTRYYDDEVELIDILRVIWRWKWFIAVVVICGVAITAGVVINKYPLRTGSAAIVSLGFPGIESGENPDGSVFSPDQLTAPLIINRAVDQLENVDKNKVLSNWRDVVIASPVIPEGVKEGDVFYPDKFKVSVFAKTREGESVFSGKSQTENFLLKVVAVYKDEFEKQYIETFLLPSALAVDDLQPLGALAVIKQKVERLSSEIAGLPPEAARYKSKNKQASLKDVAQAVKIFGDIELKNVMTRMLPKFYSDSFVETYKTLSRNIEKKQAEATAARNMLDQLLHDGKEKESEEIILDSRALEQYSRMDVRRYLVEKAINAEIATDHLRVDLNALQADYSDDATEALPPRIIKLKDRAVQLCDLANAIYSEYMRDRLDGTIRQITDVEPLKKRDLSLKLVVGLAAVVSLFLAIFTAFFIEYVNKARHYQTNR